MSISLDSAISCGYKNRIIVQYESVGTEYRIKYLWNGSVIHAIP